MGDSETSSCLRGTGRPTWLHALRVMSSAFEIGRGLGAKMALLLKEALALCQALAAWVTYYFRSNCMVNGKTTW